MVFKKGSPKAVETGNTDVISLTLFRSSMSYKLILLGLVCLSGCATTSPTCHVPFSSDENAAKIVVYRPYGLVGLAYSTPMSINGCKVGSLSNDSYYVYPMPPGLHRIAVEKRVLELGSGASVEMKFEAGKTYYLRQYVDFVANLAVVDKSTALREMPRIEQQSK